MAEKTISTRQKQKYDTSTNWSTNNIVLLAGEIGIESDTNKFKVGNGTSAWNELDYAGGGDLILYSTTGQNTDGAMTQKAVTDAIPTALSDLNEDSSHRTVTDAEKTTWNNKSNFSGDYDDLTNKPTIPTTLAELTEDSTHRLVTDTEKSTWNAKSDFSGSYNDLTDKPTIPTNNNQLINGAGYTKVTVNNVAQSTINFDSDPQTQLDDLDTNCVKLDGAQNISGVKNFTSGIKINDSDTISYSIDTLYMNASVDVGTGNAFYIGGKMLGHYYTRLASINKSDVRTTLLQPITEFSYILIVNRRSGDYRMPTLIPVGYILSHQNVEFLMESWDGSRFRIIFTTTTANVSAAYYATPCEVWGIK